MSSPTTTITAAPGSEQVTLINVFTVAPERQEELVAALDRSTADIFVHVPGFVSANLHVGIEGDKVINYAQWASEEHYREAIARADIREHMGEIAAIAQGFEPTLSRVRAIHHTVGACGR